MAEKETKWWKRAPEHDRRIGRGDDFAGDAWCSKADGKIKYTAVGFGPPTTGMK